MSWHMWRNDLSCFARRSEEINDEEGKVPGDDKDLDEETGDFIEDTHLQDLFVLRK